MNIAFITPSVSRASGGIFEIERRLGQSLADISGTAVSVYGLQDEHTDADLPAWHPLAPSTFAIQGPRGFGYSSGLRAAFQQELAEVAHLHALWMFTSLVVHRWSQRQQRPYVVTPNGMLDPWALRNSAWKKRIAGLFFERSMLSGAACIQANTEKEAADIRAYGLRNPLCIIPNGIDLPVIGNAEMLKTEMLKSASAMPPWAGFVEPGRKVLLFLSRIHPKKGLVNLLRAWSAVSNRQSSGFCPPSSDWCLAIAGWDQGGHEAELKSLATELNIPWTDVRDRRESDSISAFSFQGFSVLFLGPVFGQEKAASYRNCDAFVLPSFSEGLPMVVLEAWAYGKPVLMTPECNLPEGFAANAAIRIEHSAQRAGKKLEAETLKAEIEKSGSIEDGLRELFALDDAARLALGASGRSLVASRFTWPKVAAEMKSVYEWVLGGGSRPASVI